MTNLQFKPIEFINNLDVMGTGLLGVFIIVGIIIGATYAISYFTSKQEYINLILSDSLNEIKKSA